MSDQDETIFESKTNQDGAELIIGNTDQYADLIGEGKKYATVDAALGSVAPAQDHISKLEEEMEVLKAELETRKTVEDTLNSLVTTKDEGVTAPAALDEGTIEQLVANVLTKTETVKTQEKNILTVDAKMKETFGDKATEALNKKAEELGVNSDFMMSLAAKSPVAFLNQFGIDNTTPKETVGTQESTINTEHFQGKPVDPPKTVMRNATTKDMVAGWRAAGDQNNS